ncbi:MAG: helix-turn-helix domain-containing protein [Desulfobacteraceae bacterium]|nr:helix-turn-helix domain-containing protein [Desulfobacteraceae bacterium]
MIEKAPLCPERIRKIAGSFAFIEHRFLRDGFFSNLNRNEVLLYLFLVLVSDRTGLSYYSYDRICTILRICTDEYIEARNALIEKDLIAFDGRVFQVLSLPEIPVVGDPKLLKTEEDMARRDPATVHQIIVNAIGEGCD